VTGAGLARSANLQWAALTTGLQYKLRIFDFQPEVARPRRWSPRREKHGRDSRASTLNASQAQLCSGPHREPKLEPVAD